MEWELEPAYTRCPYIILRYCRNLHATFKRAPNKTKAEKYALSQKLYDEVVLSEEFLFRDLGVTMTQRDNQLVNGLTKSGTVFKIWESVRLHPCVENVWAMIERLSFLVYKEPKIFEEQIYYERLLADLLASDARVVAEEIRMKLAKKIEERRQLTSYGLVNPILVETIGQFNIVGY